MAWCAVSWNQVGGSGGQTATLYAHWGNNLIDYYATQQSTSSSYRITRISSVPTMEGCRFIGYTANLGYGTDTIVDYDRYLKGSLRINVTSVTAYAQWADSFKVIKVTTGGGSPTIPNIYRRDSDGVCFSDLGQTTEMTSVPVPMKDDFAFDGVEYDGVQIIDKNGQILPAMATATFTADTTIAASWRAVRFGNVKDYFNLRSATLIPESSDSGDNKQHICAYNVTGTSTTSGEAPATETSGVWRNPSVTYRVVGDMTLSVTLGKAFSGIDSSMSGYMITSVAIHTAIGEPPTVTVTGVANEGEDAVKTYACSVAISRRHRPQNLSNAISGGGDLQSLDMVFSCDPVVLAENNMPCASDVCHGRCEVTAVTGAFNNESEPTAGTNFTQIGAPVAHSGTGYRTYSVKVRKEIT